MNLRCKPGDLALIVKSNAGNEGKIVECVRVLPNHKWCRRDGSEFDGAGWETEPPVRGCLGDVAPVPDAYLRPLRNDPGTDETLLIAGLPNKEPAHG
jgi:hypothetical protein